MKTAYKIVLVVVAAAVIVLLASCNATKYVPENELLLSRVKIKSNVDGITNDELDDYLYQSPNTYFLGIERLKLQFYNWSRPDTARRIDRWLHRIGEEPVLYDSLKTVFSADELRKVLFNKGYLNAEVDYAQEVKNRQVKVTYTLKGNTPYTVNRYLLSLPDSAAQSIVDRHRASAYPKKGELFDVDMLNSERDRVARLLRNNGYYNFYKELLYYSVDSALGANCVDAELALQPHFIESDSALAIIFSPKIVENVTILALKDATLASKLHTLTLDTVFLNGYTVVYDRNAPCFKPRALVGKTQIIPGRLYNERSVERTYSQLNAVAAVKYVNVAFTENEHGNLDALVVVAKEKPHTVSAQIEATYSDGDLGFNLGAGYKNNNIFKGFETLNISVNGGYEAIGSLNNIKTVESAWDAGGNVALSFPRLLVPSTADFRKRRAGDTEVSVSFNFQNRPEYNRIIANAGFKYRWQYRRWNFNFNLLDISYIYLPRMSDEFRDKYMKPSSSIRFSYEDHFIMRWGLTMNYSDKRNSSPSNSYSTFRAGVRTAGNLLYGISNLVGQKPNDDGIYEIFNIKYAQYAKIDLDYAYNQHIYNQTRLVMHAALGVAVPYANATILPFEERYFSGGANSMRGWAARTLGPGNFHNSSGAIDFMKQSGDIKLDLNLELRFKMIWKIHAAVFMDAGNIWTIKEYAEQPEGQFRFDKFYKQLGWNYGFGLRADFNYFVVRVDLGIKLYDPGRPNVAERWRTELNWKDDFAIHIAVGYPF